MTEAFDLLVLGDANPDVVLVDAPRRPAFGQREELVRHGELTLGGSAAIMACGAARLGLRTAFAGRVGDDAAGHFVLGALRARGVDVSACVIDPAAPTGLTVILTDGPAPQAAPGSARSGASDGAAGEGASSDGAVGEGASSDGAVGEGASSDGAVGEGGRGTDRAILTSLGTLPLFKAEDVPEELLRSVRHVHAASFFLQPRLAGGLPGLFAVARAAGATTSLDTNDDPAEEWRGLDEVLAVTDVLLPNEAEALAIARTADLTEAVELIAARGPLPVVKCGAAGALAWDGGGLVKAAPVPVEPLDTVGAGDSFDAGFVAARLRGLDVPDSLAAAALAGALSTRAHGGTAAQPTWEDIVEGMVK